MVEHHPHRAEAAQRSLADQAGHDKFDAPVAIRLAQDLPRWTISQDIVATRVDLSAVPADKTARLLLPNGQWAPTWLVLDRRTSAVSGRLPAGTSAAKFFGDAHVSN